MAPPREIWSATKEALLALVMPFIIIGGILIGFFTPTEAAAVAVVYGLLVGFLVYGNIHLAALKTAVLDTILTTGIILFILGTATVSGWVVASERMPEKMAEFLLSLTKDPYLILLIINVILFIAGMFMDTGVAIILLGPILGPVAVQMGVHPLHFAIVMCVNLSFGLITPPVGLILFVCCGITNLSMERLSKALLPFFAVEVAAIFILTYVPFISMIVPQLLGYVK
jgi:C4-dicarboxylate transporter DctM subunit